MRGETSTHQDIKEKTTIDITTVGLNLAKNVFHAIGSNEHNKEVNKRMLRRNQDCQF